MPVEIIVDPPDTVVCATDDVELASPDLFPNLPMATAPSSPSCLRPTTAAPVATSRNKIDNKTRAKRRDENESALLWDEGFGKCIANGNVGECDTVLLPSARECVRECV